MRIVGMFTEVFEIGGIQCFNRQVCLALSRFAEQEGHQVNLLSLMDDSDRVDERYLQGDTSFEGFRGNRAAFFGAALSELKERLDVVYVTHVNMAPVAFLLKVFRPALRYGIHLHGIEAWEPLPLFKRFALRFAFFVTASSSYTKERATEVQGLDPENAFVLSPPLDPYWVPAAGNALPERSLGLSKGEVLLSVARLAASERYKGVDCVIQALPSVQEQVRDVYYVVIGTGDDLPRLRELVRREGLEERVRFVGRVPEEDLRGYYAGCTLFVLPSKGEGLGIVFLEAMFYKKPVIAGDHAGSRDVVDDGRTGLLVRHGDIDGLTTAIVNLLSDETRRMGLGQAGYERLLSCYTFSQFKERLIQLIERGK